MQWNATAHAGFGSATPWIGVNADYTTVNVSAQDADKASVLNHFRNMTALRKQHPVLVYGTYKEVDPANNSVYAYTRELNGERVLVLLNFTGNEAQVNTDIDLSNSDVWISNYADAKSGKTLRPFEAMIVKIK